MPTTRTLRSALLLAAACTLGLLAGCGQKGPLYLPPPPSADTGQAQPPPAEDEAGSPPKAAPAGG